MSDLVDPPSGTLGSLAVWGQRIWEEISKELTQGSLDVSTSTREEIRDLMKPAHLEACSRAGGGLTSRGRSRWRSDRSWRLSTEALRFAHS